MKYLEKKNTSMSINRIKKARKAEPDRPSVKERNDYIKQIASG